MRATSTSWAWRCQQTPLPSSAYQPISRAKRRPPHQATNQTKPNPNHRQTDRQTDRQTAYKFLPPSLETKRYTSNIYLHLPPSSQKHRHPRLRCVLYLICRGPSKTVLDRLITLWTFHSTLECPKILPQPQNLN